MQPFRHIAARHVIVLAVAMIAATVTASAQRLVVETTTMSAVGRAVRVYMHSVDMARASVMPLPVALPGAAPLSRLSATSVEGSIALTTGDFSGGPAALRNEALTYTSVMQCSPFRVLMYHAVARDPAWRQTATAMTGYDEGPMIVMIESGSTDDGAGAGRLALYPAARPAVTRGAPISPPPDPSAVWSLPGQAEHVVLMDGLTRVAVLGHGTYGSGAWLRVLNAISGEVLLDTLPLPSPSDAADTEPGGMALSADGGRLFVVTSGYATDQSTGDPVSWIHAFDVETWTEQSTPLEIPGAARAGDQVLRADINGGVWAATRWPVAGFAYVAHASWSADGLVRDVAHSFTTTDPVLVATSPDSGEILVAADAAIERWDADGTLLARAEYASPVRVLAWTAEGCFAGESGRVHRVDPNTAASEGSVQLQSGHVSDLMLVPAQTLPDGDSDGDGLGAAEESQFGTSLTDPDTDSDGIPDGIDVEPLAPSPLLQAQPALIFRGDSVGRDVKSVWLIAYLGMTSGYRVDTPDEFASWLRVAPQSGDTPDRVLVGIDPVHFGGAPATTMSGWIDVVAEGLREHVPATLSPQRIEVHVLPKQARIRRILWAFVDDSATGLRDAADRRGLKAVADLLSAAPFYFSHEEHAGPFANALSPYTIIVMDVEAAARGLLNPHALLDFVGHGGALLLLGKHLPDTDEDSLRWLRPMGVHFDPATPVNGLFTAERTEGLTAHWGGVAIRGGSVLRIAAPADALVAGPSESGYGVFVARDYGRGRVAALAAATPLESAAMATTPARQFSEDLFRWLAQAGIEVADRDGDSLPDWMEDKNGNGALEWRETNPDRADSDGDGIDDGYEDSNWNGTLDEGETDPLQRDSDGDGVFDGADPSPVPLPGAPLVAQISPEVGPAEGGNDVIVSGKHLPSDSVVWFGTRRTAYVARINPDELLVEAPPAEEPGPVDIRVTDSSERNTITIAQAYTYLPRTQLRATLQNLGVNSVAGGIYRGSVGIALEGSPIDVRRVRVHLRADPGGVVTWGAVEAGSAVAQLGRRVTGMALRPDLLAVDLHEFPGRHLRLNGQIAVVHWESRTPPADTPLAFRIERVVTRVRSGEVVPTLPGDPLQPIKHATRPRRATE